MAASIQLQRWYSIYDRWEIPYFAYEKLPGRFHSDIVQRTIWLYLVLGICYAFGLLAIRGMPIISRWIKAGIVTAWLVPGLCQVFTFPIGALDVFRYLVALKMTFYYRENPYTSGFMHHQDDQFATHAFLLHLPNAKGPSWLWLSALPAKIAGYDDQQQLLIALKLFNLLVIGLIGLLVYRAAGGGKSGWISFWLVAANPLLLLEGIGNVHNDTIAALFLVIALIALRHEHWLALPALAVATLVKYFTLPFAPLFLIVIWRQRWPFRRLALSAFVAGAISLAMITPFWDGGAMREGIERVESAYDGSMHVSLVSLERQYRMHDLPRSEWAGVESNKELFAAIFALLALPVYLAVGKGGSPERMVNILYGLFLLFMTLLYPWYLIPLIAVMGLARTRLDTCYLVLATSLGLLYYPFYVYAHFDSGWSEFSVHLFLALFLTVPLSLWMVANYGDTLRKHLQHREIRSVVRGPVPRPAADQATGA